MDEFRDFEKYVKGVDPYGMQSGIVLIDPPEEWYAHQPFPLHVLISGQETRSEGT